MKVGDIVEFDDEHGGKKRGVVEKIEDGDPFGVMVKYEDHVWFNQSEVQVVPVVERLGEIDA